MFRASASTVSTSWQAGASALQMGGRLTRHKTGVVNGSKFSVSARALIQRGFEEVIGAAGLAMGPKPSASIEKNLCSTDLTKRGFTVAKNHAKQTVNANDTTENGDRSFTGVRKLSTDAMNGLYLRMANTTRGTGVTCLKENLRMIGKSEGTVPLIHGAEYLMLIEEMVEKAISAKDCGTEETDTSEYEEILEERLTKDCVAVPVVKIGRGANEEKDLNTSEAVVEEGDGARLANPLLMSETKPSSLNHPRLQWASWTIPTLCSRRTNYWRGVSTQTTPVTTVHGYHTSSILNSKSEAESPCAGSPHPHLVTFQSAINYFERGPALVVHVPDTNEELYKLIKYDVNQPLMLTEMGKLSSWSLVEAVTNLHDQQLCLAHKFNLSDLAVSSLGTFKLPNMETVKRTEQGRSENLACTAAVLKDMMALRHRDRVLQNFPSDYSNFLQALEDLTKPEKFIKWHPAHLPASTYALAFMKLHGLLMDNGLRSTNHPIAVLIATALPYQTGDWIKIAKKNTLLQAWYNFRGYDPVNPFHIMEFGRNVMAGHPLDHRGRAARFLPKGSSPYTEEAVNLMFQHSLERQRGLAA